MAELLKKPVDIKTIKTSGDRFLDQPLQGRLEKGFFTKEIEERLIRKEIDLAVHSLKDLPTEIDPRLKIGAYIKRAPVNDLLLIRAEWHDEARIFPLKDGCVVGATALRRQALLRLYAREATAFLLRGNVPTRLRKLKEAQFGAIIIARAGVERLNLDLSSLVVYELNPEIWLPAPGQGAIAVEARADDKKVLEMLKEINDPETEQAVFLERKLLANFGGGCHTAFGALAQRNEDKWKIIVGIEDPKLVWAQVSLTGSFDECLKHGPESLLNMKPYLVKKQEELCRRIQ